MASKGIVIGKKAPDFSLPSHLGKTFTLSTELKAGPLLLVFYPGDFTPVCTRQLCNYRDHSEAFEKRGVRIVGISHNSKVQHEAFAREYDLPFPLLTDAGNATAKAFGCASLLMLGRVSRAVFIVNPQGLILYAHVEPTILTRRSATELSGILNDLHANQLL